jgi:hypothetical protein
MFAGSTLQDDIQPLFRRLIEQGCIILGRVLPEQRNEKTMFWLWSSNVSSDPIGSVRSPAVLAGWTTGW